MKKKNPRRRIDVNVAELDRIIDGAKSAPLSESDSQKLKTALHALAERLLPRSKTEKTSSVFSDPESAVAGTGSSAAETERRDTGVMVRMRIAALRKWKSGIRRCHTAIAARIAPEATSTRRKSRKRWCGLWDRRRWPPPCMNWKDCAAMLAGRCSQPRSRKASARKSTMKQRRR